MRIDILVGDVRDRLRELLDESVHCIVTSPPYFGLRDYGTASWEGGDDPDCDHRGSAHQSLSSTLKGNGHGGDKPLSPSLQSQAMPQGGTCGKCGARRVDKQIGLEASPQEFVAALVEVFRAARRVLRSDGTLWLNLGDSYSRSPGKGGSGPGGKDEDRWGYGAAQGAKIGSSDGEVGRAERPGSRSGGLGEKQLLGVPWRVAFALQDDGWYLRQDIIWSKPNPMPESVTDRCTKAHEYLFLLSKSPRYYFDADAIKEPLAESSLPRLAQNIAAQIGTVRANGGAKTNCNFKAQGDTETGMRNKRSVWTVTTQPFKEAHFATFPPALIEPCIRAGSPKGGTILDPFGGAGTTGLVADTLQRNAILIELNPEYAEIARKRIHEAFPLSVDVRVTPLAEAVSNARS